MTDSGIITLLTDFGTVDGYVGAMKGVLLTEAPAARIVDITHEVAPRDVVAGARALGAAAPWFPAGTIHIAVVDPGVGSARWPIAVRAFGQLFLGPDNGLLSAAIAAARADHEAAVRVLDVIPSEWRVSRTFHGRDLFARVAGRLAAGSTLDEFSLSVASDPVLLADPAATADTLAADGHLVFDGEVVHVDRFGNLLSNVGVEALRRALPDAAPGRPFDDHQLAGRFLVEIAGRKMPLVGTYADVASGAELAYLGSGRHVEVAIRDGSACQLLGVGRGDRLRVHAR